MAPAPCGTREFRCAHLIVFGPKSVKGSEFFSALTPRPTAASLCRGYVEVVRVRSPLNSS